MKIAKRLSSLSLQCRPQAPENRGCRDSVLVLPAAGGGSKRGHERQRSQRALASRCRGFTLLEVIVALAVIAFALAAAASTVTNNTRNASGLQQRTYAHWVAMNKLAELQIANKWPAIRRTRGSTLLARHEWFWTIKVSKTPDKKDLLRRVDVMVRAQEDDDSPLVTVSGYVGRP